MTTSTITTEIFARYKRGDVCVETGCYHGDGIQAALDAGFSRVISIELDAELVAAVRKRFAGKPVVIIHGDSAVKMNQVLATLGEEATFWLDAHAWDSSPVLRELACIARHPVKTHTLLIDDRRLMGTDWKNVREQWVYDAIAKINPQYVVTYDDGHAPEDIIVAQVPR